MRINVPAVTTPFVVFEIGSNLFVKGFKVNRLYNIKECFLRVKDQRIKPPTKHVALSFVSPIDVLRIQAEQIAHGLGQVGALGVQNSMTGVREQGVSVYVNVIDVHRFCEDLQERPEVRRLPENGGLRKSFVPHQMPGVGELWAC